MAGTVRRMAPGYATSGPGGGADPDWTCRRCGAVIGLSWLESRLGERFCPAHQHDPPCVLCVAPVGDRPPPGSEPCCPDCAATAVRTRNDLRRALPTIRDDLHAMGIRLLTPVRIRLVTATELAKFGADGHGRTVGLTLFHADTAHRVAVLAGQPLVRFGATVAHESMHVWLSQRGFRNTPLAVEEGLCQLAAYEWLRRRSDPRAGLVAEEIDTAPDPVYGDGFRAARAALTGRGMRALLAHVRTHGRLP